MKTYIVLLKGINVGGHKKMPMATLKKFFQKGHGRQEGYFRVKKPIRAMIQFQRFNLMDSFPFRDSFDFIFCRNVMIYFNKQTQEMLVNKFYDCIVEGGYLLIGHSESLTGIDHRFKYIKPTVYLKQ